MCAALLSMLGGAVFAGSASADRTQTERPIYTQEQILNQFLLHKTAAVLQSARTYREKYAAVSFASFPRVFYEDKISSLEGFTQPGQLYRELAATVAEEIRRDEFNPPQQVQETLGRIIGAPRRVDVAHIIPFPQPGSVWQKSFAMASFYEQLGSFAARAQQTGQPRAVFEQYQRKIEQFISLYAGQSHRVIEQALAPLQTDFIAGGDAAAYVENRLAGVELPPGVEREQLIASILQTVPTRAEIYKQAREMAPSFAEQVFSLGKIISPRYVAQAEDWSRALGLLEYISVGLLRDKLQRFGHIPSHQEVLDDLAGSLAAGAVNKSVAQIANDLFEFEKPFYYSLHSFHGAEDAVAQHWHALATQPNLYKKPIAQLASANLLDSGRRAYQDEKLTSAMRNRQIDKNLEFYKRQMPLLIDVGVGSTGHVVFTAAPLFSWGKLAEKLEVKRAIRAAIKKQEKMARAALEALPANATPAQRTLATATRATRLSDDAERLVWRISDGKNKVLAYVKYGPAEELERTKELDELVKMLGLREKYPSLQIEYPQVIAEDLNALPQGLRAQIGSQLEDPSLHRYVRGFKERAQVPFIMTEVDPSGVTLVDALDVKGVELMEQHLGPGLMSKAEWFELEGFYEDLNIYGFQHSDVLRNLHLRRLPNGKLKVTLLDFEWIVGARDSDYMRTWHMTLKRAGAFTKF